MSSPKNNCTVLCTIQTVVLRERTIAISVLQNTVKDVMFWVMECNGHNYENTVVSGTTVKDYIPETFASYILLARSSSTVLQVAS